MPASPPDSSPISVHEEIFPGDTNAYGTAFGGKILALMDRAAGLAASRYARASFVTASLDALEFRAPVRQGEIAEVVARVVYTATRTCGIRVQVFADRKDAWERRLCCAGLFFMVAVGPPGSAPRLPPLEVSGAEAQAAYDEAAAVHRRMLERRGR